MAPAPKRNTTPKRSRRSPVTRQDLRDNNQPLAEAVTNKLTPYYKLALVVGAICTALVFMYQGYIGMGGRLLVTDHTLETAIGNVKTEVGTKIEDTKKEVVTNQNSIKGEINSNLGKLTETLGTISKSQSAAAMESAEMAMKLAFTQLQSLQGQMATWKQALATNPNDSAAQTRVMQLETFIRQNEADMQEAKNRMSRLRRGEQ